MSSAKTPQNTFSAPFKTPSSNKNNVERVLHKKKGTPTILTGLSQTSWTSCSQTWEPVGDGRDGEPNNESTINRTTDFDGDLGFSTQFSCASEANAIDGEMLIRQKGWNGLDPKIKVFSDIPNDQNTNLTQSIATNEENGISWTKPPDYCLPLANHTNATPYMETENCSTHTDMATGQRDISLQSENETKVAINSSTNVDTASQVYDFTLSPETRRRYLLKKRNGKSQRDLVKKQLLRLISKMKGELQYWHDREAELESKGDCDQLICSDRTPTRSLPSAVPRVTVTATSSRQPNFKKQFTVGFSGPRQVGKRGYVEKQNTCQAVPEREP